MREYGVEVCSEECGRTVLAAHDTHWIIWEFAGEVMISKGRAGYCPACGTRVGIDERGSWRESMVPRAALEYMAECWGRYDPGEINPDEAIAYALKHAEDAALKAAEEDGDE